MESIDGMYLRPIDWYDNDIKKRQDFLSERYPHGASTLTREIAEEALTKLAKAFSRANHNYQYWKNRGDNDKADIVKKQYMDESFLPAVEMVIVSATPDEVLNANDILKAFDDKTFEYGPGYTASYIRTAYGNQLGNASSSSDGYVRSAVERLKFLADSDQIRAAYGVAKKLKEQIDNGKHLCSDEDYEIITRVASIM